MAAAAVVSRAVAAKRWRTKGRTPAWHRRSVMGLSLPGLAAGWRHAGSGPRPPAWSTPTSLEPAPTGDGACGHLSQRLRPSSVGQKPFAHRRHMLADLVDDLAQHLFGA